MSKVTNLVDVTGDARQWGLEQMLQDALHETRMGGHRGKKALILFLDDEADYLVGFSQCGMTTQECVLLCEMGKDRFKQELFE
jgi:hypothetical protein